MARVTITFTDSPDGDGTFAVVCEPGAASLMERIHTHGDYAGSPAEHMAVRCLLHILKHVREEKERQKIVVVPEGFALPDLRLAR